MKLNDVITLTAVGVLSSVMVAVVFTLLYGLFNPAVDNNEVFKTIDPAFQTITGALVGLVCGRLSKSNSSD
ncbi:MAG: hypothetical protein EBU90_25385 [Proteobacteria bacterium]|nr:hypothetical protein [Pseudomonadota bacterium]